MRCLVACGTAAAVALSACAVLEPPAGFPVERPQALAPADGAIAVVGDLQVTPWLVRAFKRRERNLREQRRLVADLRARLDSIAALAVVGDLVFNARSRSDWRHFDALIGPVAERVPVLPALGNHDYRCWLVELCSHARLPRHVRRRFPWLEPGTPYEVAFGDVALVFLDSETRLAAQGRWLTDRLDGLETRYAALVVFIHRPPWTATLDPDPEPAAAVREHIASELRRTRLATLVVSGHEHGYEHMRVGGVDFVISAGGGGPRDALAAERPRDVYAGPDCRRGASGTVVRPFNYLLLTREPGALEVRVRGLCRGDTRVVALESFRIPLPERSAGGPSGIG